MVAATDESSPSDEVKFTSSSSSSSSRFAEDRRKSWWWWSSGGSSVWFHASVIAVPIIGLVVLVLLVLVAAHLLAADSRSHAAALDRRRTARLWRWRCDVESSLRPDTTSRTLPRYEKIISCVCSNMTYPLDVPCALTDHDAKYSLAVA